MDGNNVETEGTTVPQTTVPRKLIDRILYGLSDGPNQGKAWLADLAQSMKDELAQGSVPKPLILPISSFMAQFGHETRGVLITGFIRNALEEAGLETVPDFDTPWRGSEISLRLREAHSTEDPIAELTDATHRVGALDAAHINEGEEPKLATVPPDKPLSAATTIMQLRDFSQLPVMPNNNKRDVKGIITWQSIGARLALGHECHLVKDCMYETVQTLPIGTPLFEALGTIVKHGYALIRSDDNTISGIVTASDLASQFENIAGPFILSGEIEGHLRRLVSGKFTVEQMRDVCAGFEGGKEINGAADLTLGGYCALLGSQERWMQLGLGIDRVEFLQHLEKARQVRNDVMHFNPDGISPDRTETLHNLARFFQDLVQMRAI